MNINKKALSYFLSLTILGLFLSYQLIQSPQPGFSLPKAINVSPSPIVKLGLESTASADLGIQDFTTAQVTRAIDGDTIEVNIDGKLQKLRYIGINTPETVDPRKEVECFGHEASAKNKSLVEGKTVLLTKDISETDRYGRLLRYVYLLDQGELIFINDRLVREGYAQVDTFPPDVKFVEQFKNAEKEAENFKRGLWENCR